MLTFPQINPVAINIGSFGIHWYGLMYLTGFLIFLYGGKYKIRHSGHPVLAEKDMDDFLFYGAMGVILGGRIGYCLFYRPELYLMHPLNIIKTWDGGMSFHGGLLGVCLGVYLFSRKLKCSFLQLMDFCAVFVPVGLLLGRINGELWGRICSPDLPWGMVFPDGGPLPRHPSQIYEALTEGLLLLTVMILFSRKERKIGQTCSLFVILYGFARFGLEFFREPDAFATGIVKATGLSLGQFYSIPMVIIGLVFFILASRGKFTATTA
jgi:phosphatidylglycerol:prolipoprotein diacylglycerol transferase